MMRKIEPLEQLKWIIVSVPTAAGFCYSAVYAADILSRDVPAVLLDAAPAIGVSLALGGWLLYQFDLLRSGPRSRRQPIQLQSIAPAFSLDPDIKSWQVKWKDDKHLEFDFYGLGLPGRIPESIFHRFVKLAYRRQTNALYGSKINLVRGAGGEFKRLTANQIFTRNYFTQDCRPRFLDDDYTGCLYTLTVCRMLIGRGQGKGGVFRGEYGPDKIVDICKDRWLRLLSPYSGQRHVGKFLDFWRKFTN